jgi:hypothetical protein
MSEAEAWFCQLGAAMLQRLEQDLGGQAAAEARVTDLRKA